jgi:Zinc-binding dehydrogenase
MIPERTGLFEKKLRTTAISPSSGRCPNDTALWPRSRARVGSSVRAQLGDDGLGERRRILPELVLLDRRKSAVERRELPGRSQLGNQRISHGSPVDTLGHGEGDDVEWLTEVTACGRMPGGDPPDLLILVMIGPGEMLELTRTALAEAATGRLRPLIGQTFPLERTAQAHAAVESRATVGKTLLVLKAD